MSALLPLHNFCRKYISSNCASLQNLSYLVGIEMYAERCPHFSVAFQADIVSCLWRPLLFSIQLIGERFTSPLLLPSPFPPLSLSHGRRYPSDITELLHLLSTLHITTSGISKSSFQSIIIDDIHRFVSPQAQASSINSLQTNDNVNPLATIDRLTHHKLMMN